MLEHQTYVLVVDDAGRVEHAIRESRPDCAVTSAQVFGATAFFTFASATTTGFFVAERDVAVVPRALESAARAPGRTYVGGDSSYLVAPEQIIKRTADGAVLASLAPAARTNTLLRGDTMFFEPDDPARPRVEVVALPDAAARDLVAFGESSSGAADFGTDGRDSVWVEGAGRGAVGDPFASVDIFTAAYATRAGSIQKRRVRSEVSFGSAPFVVGCGYAAHAYRSAADGAGVRLVHLADGQSWRFRDVAGSAGSWHFEAPLAISCTEVFVRASVGTQASALRVPLANLPPAEPAD